MNCAIDDEVLRRGRSLEVSPLASVRSMHPRFMTNHHRLRFVMFMYYRCYALFLPPSLGKTYEPFPLLVFRIPEVSLRRYLSYSADPAVRCFRSDRAVKIVPRCSRASSASISSLC